MSDTLCHETGQGATFHIVTRDSSTRHDMTEDAAWSRLKQRRIAVGYRTAAAFARAVGVNATTYRSHESPPDADRSRRLDAEDARRYAPKLAVDWRWLLHGDAAYAPQSDALPARVPEELFVLTLRTIVEALGSPRLAEKLERQIKAEGEALALLTNAEAGRRPDDVRVKLLVRGIQAACEELLSDDAAPPLDRTRLARAAENAPALLRVLSAIAG